MLEIVFVQDPIEINSQVFGDQIRISLCCESDVEEGSYLVFCENLVPATVLNWRHTIFSQEESSDSKLEACEAFFPVDHAHLKWEHAPLTFGHLGPDLVRVVIQVDEFLVHEVEEDFLHILHLGRESLEVFDLLPLFFITNIWHLS